MSKDFSNSDDVIDSRNVIERIKELENELEYALDEAEDSVYDSKDVPGNFGFTGCDSDSYTDEESAIKAAKEKAQDIWEESEEGEELSILKALADEAEPYAPDWKYGETLIRDSYFVEYCKELVNDIGDLPRELPSYIENNINWEGVAEDLQVDYTSVDFDGVTYWIR